jgi:protein involved in polysaccharide export with SLBB domain
MFRKRDLLGEGINPMLKMQEVIRTYPIVPSDSLYFLLNNQVGMDPVNVNMYKVLIEDDPHYDVPLQDGDYIFIAYDRKSVLVQGQVRFPGYVPVKPGAPIEYYIEKAGGFTEYADDGGTRIIKRATQSWLEPDEGTIESGDIIWVPKEAVRDFAYYLSIVRDLGVLLGSMVTIGLIIVQIEQISKN